MLKQILHAEGGVGGKKYIGLPPPKGLTCLHLCEYVGTYFDATKSAVGGYVQIAICSHL